MTSNYNYCSEEKKKMIESWDGIRSFFRNRTFFWIDASDFVMQVEKKVKQIYRNAHRCERLKEKNYSSWFKVLNFLSSIDFSKAKWNVLIQSWTGQRFKFTINIEDSLTKKTRNNKYNQLIFIDISLKWYQSELYSWLSSLKSYDYFFSL